MPAPVGWEVGLLLLLLFPGELPEFPVLGGDLMVGGC